MAAAKKKSTTKRKSATKKLAKRPVSKSTAKKRVAKNNTRKKVTAKKTTRRKSVAKKTTKKTKTSDTVQLPAKADDEMKDKAVVLHQIVDRLHVPMKQIAYVGAVCFMLVGLVTLSTEYLPVFSQQSASVCDSGGCYDDPPPDDPPPDDPPPDDPPPDDPPPDDPDQGDYNDDEELEPQFDFFNNLPNRLVGTVQISFQVLFASSVYGELINEDTGDLDEFPIQKLSPENYRFNLHEADYEPGDYTVVIVALNQLGHITGERVLGDFRIEKPETDDGSNDDNDQQPPDDPEPDLEDEIDNPDDLTDATDYTDDEQETDPNADDETDYFEYETTQENENGEPVFLNLSLPNPLWEGREIINAVSSQDYSNVELYARSEMSLQANFLGRMDERDETENRVFWIYSFDSNNLPNGQYEIFGLAEVSGTTHTTNSVWTEVVNPVNNFEPIPLVVNETPDTTSGEFETNQSNEPLSPRPRDFFTLKDDDVNENDIETEEYEQVPTEVEEQVDDLIHNNRDEINDLLERYAVAVQADDPVTLDILREEIKQTRERFVTDAIADQEEGVARVDRELFARFEDLRNRVDTFEEVRKTRTRESIDKDSDGDGISDYDETNVYGTNPNEADSDRDGFIDGVEVARGYDPMDSKPEVVVDFELPTEVVGLTRADALEVTDVRPLISIDQTNNKFVEAEIRGVGLPNSYVTLYIFSSPVIVTVKTEEDGSFVYRFDKELEDGEHEVFVAFTDNSGDILAHSEPFQFVKRAQAFTPVNAAEIEVVTEAPSVVEASTTNAVKVVLGMSVLVFGFILIMFGIYLRQNEPVVEEIIAEDDKQTA